MKDFITAYKECLLWSSIGDDGEPLYDWATFDDFAPEAIAQIESDCALFISDPAIAELVADLSPEICGHDFWLTRNHHGSGFWDHRYPKSTIDALMAQCRKFKELDAVRGDDGLIYLE